LQLQSKALAKLEGATDEEIKRNEVMNTKIYDFIRNAKTNDLKTPLKMLMKEEFNKLQKSSCLPKKTWKI
jgi:hypothetical protein